MRLNLITLTEPNGQCKQFFTDSFILLTVENNHVKATGDIALKDLGPLLLELAMKKFGGK